MKDEPAEAEREPGFGTLGERERQGAGVRAYAPLATGMRGPNFYAAASEHDLIECLAAASRSPEAALIEGQVFIDDVADDAIAAAPEALRPIVAEALKAIDASTGYDDLRERFKKVAAGESPAQYRRLVEGTLLLALAAGAYSVSKEAE